MKSNPLIKLKSLQAGRAVACLLVLFYHLGGIIKDDYGAPLYYRAVIFGHLGVTYFFVLSGFIIFHAHVQDIGLPSRAIAYLKKRFVRIYPVYWAVIAVILAKSFTPHSSVMRPDSIYSWVASLLLLPQHKDGDLTGGVHSLLNPVAWTLQYEIIFYVYFLILILNKRFGVILGLGALLVYLIAPTEFHFPLYFMLKQPFLLVFGFGVFAAWFSRIPGISSLKCTVGIIGLLIVIAYSAFQIAEFRRDYSDLGQLAAGLGFSLIIISLVSLEKNGIVLGRGGFFQLLGAASYSIYLIHNPLMAWANKILHRHHLFSSVLPLVCLVLGLLAVVVGVFFHKGVELPLISFFRKRLHV